MRLVIYCLVVNLTFLAGAQTPKVPAKMKFADLNLKITKGAQYKIQKEVDKLHRSKTYFDIYVKKADLHFPVIEEEFRKLGCPEDIKYLILQETGINATAVSTSNAVGYWQFKKATGLEVGLTISGGIDERKNIAAASTGCATYMTRNNKRVKNWIYAVMAYNTGVGGAEKYIKAKNQDVSKMEINSSTHWYVIKFLAHVIAYRDYIGKEAHEQKLLVVVSKHGQSVKSVAKKYRVSQEDAKSYNEWIGFAKRFPSGNSAYQVILPIKYDDSYIAKVQKETKVESVASYDSHAEDLSLVIPLSTKRSIINERRVLIPKKGESVVSLALLGQISQKKFRKYNELRSFDQIIPGMPYFLQTKKSKAKTAYHVVQAGETTWSIAQKHGVKEWSLRIKNRMKKLEALVLGRVLWLQQIRPESVPIEIRKVKKANETADFYEPIVTESVIKANLIQEKESSYKTDSIVKSQDNLKIVDQEVIVNHKSGAKALHVVQKGETLYSISQKYGISVDELKAWNSLGNQGLSIGDKLLVKPSIKLIKEGQKGQIEFVIYKVQAGDTMYSLSKKFNIPVEDIKKWNNKVDNSLSLDESLKIKK